MRNFLLAMCLTLAGCASQSKQGGAGETTVVVVRHAEKSTEPPADPLLTEAGIQRAMALLETVRAMPVGAVISTQVARTKATAAPVAAAFGRTVEIVDARAKEHVREVADGILAKHRGETVVVVGHSNTVTEIVEALGAPRPPALCDGDYDNLYVVHVPAAGPATVDLRKYGAPSPTDVGCPKK